jgi:palmitoyl-[glycerolipid] 3-(E)-desaturase
MRLCRGTTFATTPKKALAGVPFPIRGASRRGGRVHLALPAATAAPTLKEESTEVATPSSVASDDEDLSYFGPSISRPSTSGRVVVESQEELRSTPEHRFWVGLTTALLTGTLAVGVQHIDGPVDVASSVAAALLAYSLSDLGTGIYHWGVDNYGEGSTPIVGSQIAAFQGHHRRPWTITEREFCNNVHKVFKPAAAPAALLFASSFAAPAAWSVWSAIFLYLACMSQQFHAWSHMKRSQLHPLVVAAQESGILISRKAHGAHHKAPFEGNYCIVSGNWNPILDGDGGEGSFFRKLERVVYDIWGVEPRCWSDPKDDWAEEMRA